MRLIVTVVMLSTLASVVFAQRGFRRGFAPAADQPLVGEPKEWTFARVAYDDTALAAAAAGRPTIPLPSTISRKRSSG
jgi:hypothetical protein